MVLGGIEDEDRDVHGDMKVAGIKSAENQRLILLFMTRALDVAHETSLWGEKGNAGGELLRMPSICPPSNLFNNVLLSNFLHPLSLPYPKANNALPFTFPKL
jgi:hypothetical protein